MTDRKIKLLLMEVASHGKVSNKWGTIELKPSRRGTVNGNGKGKLPKNPYRLKVTFSELAKRTVSEMVEENQL